MTHYAMLIDQERCLGCHACAIACQVENGLAEGSWLRVETAGGRMDVPSGVYPDLSLSYYPIACQHCGAAPCIDACPLSGIYRRDDGLVLVDQAACNGCAACVAACPYDAIRLNADSGVAEKCTYCAPRLAAGLAPFCVLCCEGRALFFGDLDDPSSEVAFLLSVRDAQHLCSEAGTAPTTYFIPPRAPRGV